MTNKQAEPESPQGQFPESTDGQERWLRPHHLLIGLWLLAINSVVLAFTWATHEQVQYPHAWSVMAISVHLANMTLAGTYLAWGGWNLAVRVACLFLAAALGGSVLGRHTPVPSGEMFTVLLLIGTCTTLLAGLVRTSNYRFSQSESPTVAAEKSWQFSVGGLLTLMTATAFCAAAWRRFELRSMHLGEIIPFCLWTTLAGSNAISNASRRSYLATPLMLVSNVLIGTLLSHRMHGEWLGRPVAVVLLQSLFAAGPIFLLRWLGFRWIRKKWPNRASDRS